MLSAAIVHQSTEDDVYDEYFIPKGTMVMPNTWCVLSRLALVCRADGLTFGVWR